jgi:hypothetical protein
LPIRKLKRLAWTLCLGALLPLSAQGASAEAKPAPEPGLLVSLLNKAEDCLGIPYRSGGSSTRGFDCSGFVHFVFGSVGIKLDRSSAAQAKQGEPIALTQIQPGDLLFFNTRGVRKGISHVGIYLGQGQFIHASSLRGPGTHCVKLANLASDYFANRLVAARRVATGVTEIPKDILNRVFKEQDQDSNGSQDVNAQGGAQGGALNGAPNGAARQP